MLINEKTPNFQGDPKIKIKQVTSIEKEGINKKVLTIHTHFSTPVNAPAYMVKNGKTLTDFPMKKFIGERIVLDIHEKKRN